MSLYNELRTQAQGAHLDFALFLVTVNNQELIRKLSMSHGTQTAWAYQNTL